MAAIAEADPLQQFAGPVFNVAAGAGQLRRQQHIFFSGERRHQLIGLKDKPDLCAAHARQPIFPQIVISMPSSMILPEVAVSSPAIRAQQRALAAPGRAHDGHKFAPAE